MVDATIVETWARPSKMRWEKGEPKELLVSSADPDAAWNGREPDVRDDEDTRRSRAKFRYGREATFVVSGTDDPSGASPMEGFILGVGLHRLGSGPASRRRGSSLTSASVGIAPSGWPVTGPYSNARPSTSRSPPGGSATTRLRLHVYDYNSTELGVQDQYAGFLQVDGNWYSPSMPDVLTTATKDFREGRIPEETYRQRLKERLHCRARLKERRDADGYERYQCPAAGSSPTATCELKPRSEKRRELKVPVRNYPGEELTVRPPQCCRQDTVVIPPTAEAKFAQKLAHGSDEWHAVYATLRNTVEGMNGFIKDGAHEALGDPSRRRVHGVAAQSIFVGLLAMAANVRKLRSLTEQGAAPKRGRRRRRPEIPVPRIEPDTYGLKPEERRAS